MSRPITQGWIPESPPAAAAETLQQRVTRELHAELVASLDLRAVGGLPRAELGARLRGVLTEMMHRRNLPLTREEQERVLDDVVDEVVGYGPIERLLRAPDISDILINGPDTVYIERKGKLESTDTRFRDADHLMHVLDRIVSAVGRRVDESSPIVDARLPDGSRVNAIIPPLALDGPMVSIRRFGANPITRADLISLGTVPEPVMVLLEGCVRARLNVLVSGGTGSGKTTLLNVLSSFIPTDERIVTIEDAAELRLQQPHVVRLETRPQNLEGVGEVTARDLVRNSLRMRPDRIIVGEIRGGEAVDMLQAMNTGHEGSVSTIHANSPRHSLGRLQTMVGLGLNNISGQAIREMIADALDLILQVNRLPDGSRRLVSVTEVNGLESGVITTQEVFHFVQTSVDPKGKVHGRFESTGVRPHFASRLEAWGIPVSAELFSYRSEV